jgi:hypothetical protein
LVLYLWLLFRMEGQIMNWFAAEFKDWKDVWN